MTFNELKSFASKNHVNTNKMNRAQIEQALAEQNLVWGAKRGRKTNPTSARQIRLARMGTVKRGRPVENTSARQARLARMGTVKRGRPVNPNSVRQIALNAVKSAESTDIQTA